MLFNKNNNGSIELQQLTGIFAAANDYSVIAAEVDNAIQAVSACVSSAVVKSAEGMYEAGTDNPLVDKVRLPVAVLAVSRYSRNNLVSHEDSGSKIKVDTNEKIPFEWMIDRDEQAQRERYYRSLDALYGYLENSNNTDWQASETRKLVAGSIIKSLNQLELVYPIDGSYYVYYMLQGLIVECQTRLKKMVGDDNWKAMTDGTATEKSNALLPPCRRWAVISALIKAVRRWSLEVFPREIARRFSPSYQGNRSSQVATQQEMEAYVNGLEAQLKEIQDEIAEILSDGENPYADFDPMPHGHRRNKFFSAQ